MATYVSSVGYFPRLALLLPHVIVLTILLTAHSAFRPAESNQVETPAPPLSPQLPEGSPEWYSNLQAIQNMMGG